MNFPARFGGTLLAFFSGQALVSAQDSTAVQVNGTNVSSWFGQNWMWVAGVIVLLVILLIIASGRSRRKQTTVVRRGDGHVTTTTTVEED